MRRSNNGREKKKGKKSKKLEEPQPKSSKPKNRVVKPGRFKFKPTAVSLNDVYCELTKTGKLYIGNEKSRPIAIYIEKTNFSHDPHPNYTLFLKFPGHGKKNWVNFSLDTLKKDPNERESDHITLIERSMVWDDEVKGGFEKWELEFYYHIHEGTGRKELAKMRKSVKKRSRALLFGRVIDTAWKILDNYSDGHMVKLVYKEYPAGTERVYPDAKDALWAIERSLANQNTEDTAREKSLETMVA